MANEVISTPSKRERLYNNLIGTGKVTEQEIGTKDDFVNSITDNESAKYLYNNLKSKFDEEEIGDESKFLGYVSSDFSGPLPAGQGALPLPTNPAEFKGFENPLIPKDIAPGTAPLKTTAPLSIGKAEAPQEQGEGFVTTEGSVGGFVANAANMTKGKYWENALDAAESTSKTSLADIGIAKEYVVQKASNTLAKLSNDPMWKGFWTARAGLSKEQNKKYDDLKSTAKKLTGQPGEATGAMVPFVAMAAATILTKSPALAASTTGMFGAMGFGEGIQNYKEFKEGTGQPVNEYEMAGTGMLYAAAMAGGFGGMLIKAMPKGLVPKAIQMAFKSNPEVTGTMGREIFENFARKSPNMAKQLLSKIASGAAHGVVSMEVMNMSKLAVDDFLIGKDIKPKDYWATLEESAISGAIFGTVLAPFSLYAQNSANKARREAQGTITITKDAKNNPIEILPVRPGSKANNKGLTPNGRLVDVTPEQVNNSFTMATKDFNNAMDHFKQTKEVPKDIERTAYLGRVANSLDKIADKNGNISVPEDPNSDVMAIIRPKRVEGTDRVGQEVLMKDGSIELVPLMRTRIVNKTAVWETFKNKYDETNPATSTEQSPGQNRMIGGIITSVEEVNARMQEGTIEGLKQGVVGGKASSIIKTLANQRASKAVNALDELANSAPEGDYGASLRFLSKLVKQGRYDNGTENEAFEEYQHLLNSLEGNEQAEQIKTIASEAVAAGAFKAGMYDAISNTIEQEMGGRFVNSKEPNYVIIGTNREGEQFYMIDRLDSELGKEIHLARPVNGGEQVALSADEFVNIDPLPKDEWIDNWLKTKDALAPIQQAADQQIQAEEQQIQVQNTPITIDEALNTRTFLIGEDRVTVIDATEDGIIAVDDEGNEHVGIQLSDLQRVPVEQPIEQPTMEGQPVEQIQEIPEVQQINEQPIEAPAVEAPVEKPIPLTKDGSPDYDAMEPEMLFSELSKDFAPEEVAQTISEVVTNLQTERKAVEKKPTKSINEAVTKKRKLAEIDSRIKGLQSAIASQQKPQEAQQPAGLTINDGLTITKSKNKNGKVTPFQGELRELGEPTTPHELVAHHIASGLRLKFNDAGGTKGFAKHLGIKPGSTEFNRYFGVRNEKEGLTPERFAEFLAENDQFSMFSNMDTMDILGVILDVVPYSYSKRKALEYIQGERKRFNGEEYDNEAVLTTPLTEAEYDEIIDDYYSEKYVPLSEADISLLDQKNIEAEQEKEYWDLVNNSEDLPDNETGRNSTTGIDRTTSGTDVSASPAIGDQGQTNIEGGIDTGSEGRQSEDASVLQGAPVVQPQYPTVSESGEQGGIGLPENNNQPAPDEVSLFNEKLAKEEAKVDLEASDKQREAGNYQKGHIQVQGFNVSIENPKGSVRSGVDESGKKWEITMNNTYGYILGTTGKDADHIDIFLGENPQSDKIFVVDQINKDGSFDEHKIMLAFEDIESAKAAYLSNYEEGWQGLGNITGISVDGFRKWTDNKTRRIKPFAEYKHVKEHPEVIQERQKAEEQKPAAKEAWEMTKREYVRGNEPTADNAFRLDRAFINKVASRQVEESNRLQAIINKKYDEFRAQGLTHEQAIEKENALPEHQKLIDNYSWINTNKIHDLMTAHEKAIKQALSEGKNVPEEVLDDYPELKKVKQPEAVKQEAKEPESPIQPDEETGNAILFRDTPYFYSPTEQALNAIKQEKATPEQWKAMLLKNGAKQAEMEWMQFDEFAEGKKSLSRADIQEWIDQNRIEIKEVEKGKELNVKEIGEAQYRFDNLNREADRLVEQYPYESRPKDIQQKIDEIGAETNKMHDEYANAYDFVGRKNLIDDTTKYSGYTTPGGEDYKELLLTMPVKRIAAIPVESKFNKDDVAIITRQTFDSGKRDVSITYEGKEVNFLFKTDKSDEQLISELAESSKEVLEKRANSIAEAKTNKDTFKSNHFDEPNILAHIRFNERIGKNGERVLFIEEIQSDWAQKGKKEGFASKINVLPNNYTVKQGKVNGEDGWKVFDENNKLIAGVRGGDKEGAIRYALTRLNDDTDLGKVPNMPFKKTDQWVNLSLRRMMAYAAENGFSAIAWTTGEMQAERYDLSKQVDKIVYERDTENEWQTAAHKVNQAVRDRLPESEIDKLRDIRDELKDNADKKGLPTGKYHLTVYGIGGSIISDEYGIDLKRIEELAGKEIAQKIDENPRKTGALSGLDLKVGGEGMKAFYDNIIPNAANKMGKSFGAQTGTIEIPKGEVLYDENRQMSEGDLSPEAQRLTDKAQKSFDNEDGNYSTEDYIYDMAKLGYLVDIDELTGEVISLKRESKGQYIPVQSIPITDKIREQAAIGMPLFSIIGEKGASALDIADEAGARMNALSVARNMESSGKKAKEILMATGWQRGSDKMWRYELPDILNEKLISKRTEGKYEAVFYAEDVYSKELISAYPEIKDVLVKVAINPANRNRGSYANGVDRSAEGLFDLSPEINVSAKDIQNAKEILIHEIQHYIQDKEGFAEGGSPAAVFDSWDERKQEEYKRLANEYEDLKEAASEFSFPSEVLMAIREVRSSLDKMNLQKQYWRLSGEVEARNASNRSKMTEAERRSSLLENTEDVSRRDQIYFQKAKMTSIKLGNTTGNIMAAEALALAETLNAPVRIISDINEIPASQVRFRKAKGWFDPKTGDVIIVLPNNNSVADIQATILHEVVAHKGLRELLGSKFNSVMEDVFRAMPDYAKADFLAKYGDRVAAAEEYTANMSEKDINPSVWEKIKAIIRKAFRAIGVNLRMNDGDIAFMLWKSKNKLKNNPTAMETAKDIVASGEMKERMRSMYQMTPQSAEIARLEAIRKGAVNEKNRLIKSGSDRIGLFGDTKVAQNDMFGGEGFDPSAINGLIKEQEDLIKTTDTKISLLKRNEMSGLIEASGQLRFDNAVNFRDGDLFALDTNTISLTRGERIIESQQDRMVSGTKLIEEIKKRGGKVGHFSNFVTEETRSSSRAKAEMDDFEDNYFKPMIDKVGEWAKKGIKREETELYVMAKHAPERNRAIVSREARDKVLYNLDLELRKTENKRKTATDPKKIAGIDKASEVLRNEIGFIENEKNSALINMIIENGYDVVFNQGGRGVIPDNLTTLEYMMAVNAQKKIIGSLESISQSELGNNRSGMSDIDAAEIVKEFEKRVQPNEITEFWKSVNAATQFSLDKSRKYGLISDETYKATKGMYQHYVPLRSWAEKEKIDYQDIFGSNYLGHEILNSVNKQAEGRTSLADNPFGFIASMAESSVVSGNKNEVRRNAWRLIKNNGDMTDLFLIKNSWEINVADPEDAPMWEETFVPPTQEQLDLGIARPLPPNNTYKWHKTKGEIEKHQVPVYIDGNRVIMEFKGTIGPRVAAAINGENVVRWAHTDGIAQFTRVMAALKTSKNPDFMLTNFLRDFFFGNMAYYVRGGNPAMLTANLGRSWYAIHKNFTKGNEDPYLKQMFEDFKMNGGQTGYVYMLGEEKYEKKIERMIKRANEAGKISPTVAAKRTFEILNHGLEYLAHMSEDAMRFSVYLTEVERMMKESSITTPTEAIKKQGALAAKDATTNFNRKGRYGSQTNAFYAFFNASIQGTTNYVKLAKENPARFITANLALMGIRTAFAAWCLSLIGGDDDDEGYAALMDYIKENNFVIPAGGNKFITIPLPHGARATTSIGPLALEVMLGRRKGNVAAMDYLKNNVSEVSPIGLVGLDKSALIIPTTFKEAILTVVPTAIRPLAEVAANMDYMARNIERQNFLLTDNNYVPRFQNAYSSTAPIFIGTSKQLNRLAGGNDERTAGLQVDKDGNVYRSKIRELFDTSPAYTEHIIEGYLGGVGRFVNDLYKTSRSVVNGKVPAKQNIPVFRRLYQEPYETKSWQNFYTTRDRVNDIEQAKKAAKEVGNQTEYVGLNNAYNNELTGVFSAYNDVIRNIAKNKRMLPAGSPLVKQADEAIDGLVKNLDAEIKEIDKRYNRR